MCVYSVSVYFVEIIMSDEIKIANNDQHFAPVANSYVCALARSAACHHSIEGGG